MKHYRLSKATFLGILSVIVLASCGEEVTGGGEGCTNCPQEELIIAEYDPQAYTLNLDPQMGEPLIPADNPLTVDGVELGRRLFYDPILSADSSVSCASCHSPALGFADGQAFSTGIAGERTRRSSMPLINLAFNPNGFFWDGRSPSLEDQALHPVEDRIEMDEDWNNVMNKLRRHPEYPRWFRRAFGIERKSEMNRGLAVKAIAQFERILISQDSRFDRVVNRNEGWLTDSEQRGKDLFYVELNALDHPGCSHCHGGVHFTDFSFRNNGIDSVATLNDFGDRGLGGFTGRPFDNGRFKVPTLRNIALTAPYMHDGRFQTLEEVLDHYKTGGHGVENEDPNIIPFTLTDRQKQDMIAFLRTLTDTSFVNNPAFANPFR